MTPRSARRFYQTGLLVLTWVLVAPGSAPGADKELERVIALIKRQQDNVKVVRIRAEGKRVINKRNDWRPPTASEVEVKKGPLSGAEKIDLKQDFLLDFQGRRYRHTYEDVIVGERGTWVQVFDGKKVIGSKIDVPIDQVEGIPVGSMSIYSGGDRIDSFLSQWWPYFASQGFILTNCDHHYYWHNIRPPIDAENLFILGSVGVDGRACDVVRTFPVGPKPSAQFYEYAIDREDGSVRRMTLWVEGGKSKSVEIRLGYRRDGDRVVPTQWTHERFRSGFKEPYLTETMTVTRVEHSPAVDDGMFRLTAKPGTIVKEQEYPNGPINLLEIKVQKTTTYQADESGQLIEGEVVNGEFRPRPSFLWWLFGGVGLTVLCAGAVAYRARSRRPPPPHAGSPSKGGSP